MLFQPKICAKVLRKCFSKMVPRLFFLRNTMGC